MLLVILVLLIVFGFGGGLYGSRNGQPWGYGGGFGLGGTILILIVVGWLFGVIRL
jgi:hypothetical protein